MLVSQRYRRNIRQALDKLRASPAELEAQKPFYDELYSAELLWSLTESVYIRPRDSLIVKDLLEWGAYCFGRTTKEVAERVGEFADCPETHSYYWNAVSAGKVLESCLGSCFR